MSRITVIDYGMGNLLSVCRAFEHLGAEVELTADPEAVRRAERLVLPGVGAFGDGMAALNDLGLSSAIREAAVGGTPVLGICLGAQMLLDGSEEFGEHQGLGLIPGRVRAIPASGSQGEPLKVPHMGWADLHAANDTCFDHPLLAGTVRGSAVYFVHSFQAHPLAEADRAAECDYAGNRLTAMISHGKVFGCQFHPEKSGPVGLQILKNFVELAA